MDTSRIDKFNERRAKADATPSPAPGSTSLSSEDQQRLRRYRSASEKHKAKEAAYEEFLRQQRATADARRQTEVTGDAWNASGRHPLGSSYNLVEKLYDEGGARGFELDDSGAPRIKDSLMRYIGRHDRLAYDARTPDQLERLLALVPGFDGDMVALALRQLRDSADPDLRRMHEVLLRRILHQESQMQVGAAVGCSQTRVSYLEQEARKYLQGFCTAGAYFSTGNQDAP